MGVRWIRGEGGDVLFSCAKVYGERERECDVQIPKNRLFGHSDKLFARLRHFFYFSRSLPFTFLCSFFSLTYHSFIIRSTFSFLSILLSFHCHQSLPYTISITSPSHRKTMAHINFSTEEAAAGWKTQARETLTYWVPEVDIKGALPKDLVGTFFRNGTILTLSHSYPTWSCFSTCTTLYSLPYYTLHKQTSIVTSNKGQ